MACVELAYSASSLYPFYGVHRHSNDGTLILKLSTVCVPCVIRYSADMKYIIFNNKDFHHTPLYVLRIDSGS